MGRGRGVDAGMLQVAYRLDRTLRPQTYRILCHLDAFSDLYHRVMSVAVAAMPLDGTTCPQTGHIVHR